MVISSELADRLYSIMVVTVGTPDIDYRRWSFVYAVSVVKVSDYIIDSNLGSGARFYNKQPPIVACAPNQITPARRSMTTKANAAIARTVTIQNKNRRIAVPVVSEASR